MGADTMFGNLLQEHEWYSFKVHKEIEFPGDGMRYVLIDPHGYKHLLRKDYYESYHIIPGQELNCRIDKINCSGKIFLEPEHPIYKEGKAYEFDFKGNEVVTRKNGSVENVLIVSDAFGNVIPLPSEDFEVCNGKIECVVESIRKGKISLMKKMQRAAFSNLNEGDFIQVKIVRLMQNSRGEDFYVATDNSGNEFLLKKKYYGNYGFKIGDTTSCRIVKIKPDGGYVVEPKHPYYQENGVYEFVIENKEIIQNYKGDKLFFLLSTDLLNLECRVLVDEETYHNTDIGSKMECVVERIKYSKVMLGKSRDVS